MGPSILLKIYTSLETIDILVYVVSRHTTIVQLAAAS
jgi:hypothetical protein